MHPVEAAEGRVRSEQSFGGEAAARSHVAGPTDAPLLDRTIGQALDEAARLWGDRPPLVCRATAPRLTWAELHVREKGELCTRGYSVMLG